MFFGGLRQEITRVPRGDRPNGFRVLRGFRNRGRGGHEQELDAGLREMLTEAAGVISIEAGNPDAARLARAFATTLQHIQAAAPGAPMLCGACPEPIPPGSTDFTVCLVTAAHREDRRVGTCFALCGRCAAEGVRKNAAAAVRRFLP